MLHCVIEVDSAVVDVVSRHQIALHFCSAHAVVELMRGQDLHTDHPVREVGPTGSHCPARSTESHGILAGYSRHTERYRKGCALVDLRDQADSRALDQSGNLVGRDHAGILESEERERKGRDGSGYEVVEW